MYVGTNFENEILLGIWIIKSSAHVWEWINSHFENIYSLVWETLLVKNVVKPYC